MTGTRLWRPVLLTVTAFNAVSAVGGGIALILFDGLGMPKSWLAGTPLTYPLAGLALLALVGGTQVLALVLLLKRSPRAPLASTVAGFGMTVFLGVELLVVPGRTLLQALYGATGLAQLGLVLALLGVLDTASRGRSGPADPRPQPEGDRPGPKALRPAPGRS